MFVKKPSGYRFAPVAGKGLKGLGIPKPSFSLLPCHGVRDVEHHLEIECEVDWRSFKYREPTRDSVFEQHYI